MPGSVLVPRKYMHARQRVTGRVRRARDLRLPECLSLCNPTPVGVIRVPSGARGGSVRMLASHRNPSLVILAAAMLGGCAIPTASTQLNPGPEPIELQMTPTVIYAGQQAELLVRSPGADSIVIQSGNGLDRWWSADSVLRVTLASDFGDPAPVERYAPEWNGRALPYLKKPVHVTACRRGYCREFYHEITVKLPERNRRVVAVAAGWSSVFARRSIRDGRRTVLFQDALTSGAWSLQGEWSAGGWNGKVQ